MRYLSDDWLEAANVAIRSMEPLADKVVVSFKILDTDSAEESYVLELGPGPVRFHRDTSNAELTLTMERSVAVAIALGQSSAQRAFLDGDLRVGGDVRILLGNSKALGMAGDHLGDLRAATDFS